MILSSAASRGKVKLRVVLLCCVIGFFAFFILAQTGLLPNVAVRKVIEAHRERALSQASRIEGLHQAALDAVPTTGPWDGASVQKATGVPVTAANTAAMHLEDLENAARNAPMPVRFCESHDIAAAVSLAREGRWPSGERVDFDTSAGSIEEVFGAIERLHYLVVVRKSFYVAPTFTGGPGDYSPGRYHADAFLFELSTGRMLGSFDFGAGTSFIIHTTATPGEKLTNERLEANLSGNAAGAFESRLAELLPAAVREKEGR